MAFGAQGAKVGVIITPPFWMKTWFVTSSVLLVLIVGFAISRRRLQTRLEKDRMLNAMSAARDLQMGLMPHGAPDMPCFDLAGVCMPAEEVGGDYYDYLQLPQDRLGIAVVDVNTRAMSGAMTTVMTSGMVHAQTLEHISPSLIMGNLNSAMYRKTNSKTFTAMLLGVLDSELKTLTFTNGGQPPPLLVRDGKVHGLDVTGPRFPLGAVKKVAYEERSLSLNSGDLVFFYTDGLTEAQNRHDLMFGQERVDRFLVDVDQSQTAEQILNQLLQQVEAFAQGVPPHDDITAVVLKVT